MAVRLIFGIRPGGAFPALIASLICLLWCSSLTNCVRVWVRSVCRPSMVGEATAEVLGPGSSSSELVLTRPTSPVISCESPSSMGVVTLSVAPVRSCSQFVGSVGFSLVGEWSGVSLGVGETCQSLSIDCWLGAGASCSVGFGVVSAGGVISSGGGGLR